MKRWGKKNVFLLNSPTQEQSCRLNIWWNNWSRLFPRNLLLQTEIGKNWKRFWLLCPVRCRKGGNLMPFFGKPSWSKMLLAERFSGGVKTAVNLNSKKTQCYLQPLLDFLRASDVPSFKKLTVFCSYRLSYPQVENCWLWPRQKNSSQQW